MFPAPRKCKIEWCFCFSFLPANFYKKIQAEKYTVSVVPLDIFIVLADIGK